MELVRGLHNLRAEHKGCVLTIGKFDGVHLGHQAVLQNLLAQARRLALPTTVMVFEPQPEEVFRPDQAPARLSTLRDKYRLFQQQGVDRLLCVRFNRAFAQQPAEAFIKEWLVDKLGTAFLVVGDDFRFGAGRRGDFTMLSQAAAHYGFTVVSTQSFCHLSQRVSSTAVRDALQQGDFTATTAMLGRPYALEGRVVHGEKKGRTIGFPTANLLLKRVKSPLAGVFVVTVEVLGQRYGGVANIGWRPTVAGERAQIEVHIFAFNGDLYGQPLKVTPLSRLRGEQKFSSFDALKQQIIRDAEQARHYLATYTDCKVL